MFCKMLHLILLILISSILSIHCQDKYISMKQLRNDKLLNYDRYSRPVKNPSTTVNVSFTFAIQQILDLDVTSQNLHVDGTIILTWTDQFINWDPIKYSGIKRAKFATDEIWRPDIMPYNTATGRSSIDSAHSSTYVDYQGRVVQILPSNIVVNCFTDLSEYPFDTQTCYLEFGSWVYDVNELNLTKSKTGRLFWPPYVANREWNVDKINGYIYTEYTSYGNNSIAHIDIQIARRVDIHVYYIFLPYLTASLMGIVVFLLPIGSVYRLVFGSLALFILINLLMFLAFNIGFHSLGVPYAIRCISINILLISLSLVVTNLAYRLIISLMMTCPPLPSFIANHLANPLLGRIFCLKGDLKQVEIDEESNSAEFSGQQQPFQSTSRAAIREWIQLLRLIDRIFFIVYIIALTIYHS